jgi:hypothetical protein
VTVSIRPAVAADAAVAGWITFDAFAAVAGEHGVPRAFSSVEDAIAAAEAFVGQPGIFGVVTERDGAIVGVNFFREMDAIAGVGPAADDAALSHRRAQLRLPHVRRCRVRSDARRRHAPTIVRASPPP